MACRCNRKRMTMMKLAIYRDGSYRYYSHVSKPHVYGHVPNPQNEIGNEPRVSVKYN